MQSRRIELGGLIVASIALLCFVWLAVKVAQGETTRFDVNVQHAIHSISNPWITRLLSAVTFLGSQAFLIGASAFAAIVAFLKGRHDRVLLLVATVAGAELWLSLVKNGFHRQRPEPLFGAHLPSSYSFPSGHALLSFCFYGLLCAFASAHLRGRIRWLIPVCAAALILAIGVSRIYLGVHYPSDVIAGYVLAISWMAVVAAISARVATMETWLRPPR